MRKEKISMGLNLILSLSLLYQFSESHSDTLSTEYKVTVCWEERTSTEVADTLFKSMKLTNMDLSPWY